MNIYPYLTDGTWEAYGSGAENYRRPGSSTVISKTEKSGDAANTGSFSGKGTFLVPATGNYNSPNFRFNLTDFVSSTVARSSSFTTLQSLKRYRFSAWVMTPSSNPIGSDDVPICIAPLITAWAQTPTTAKRTISQPFSVTYTNTTVGDCKDTWVKIQFEVFTLRSYSPGTVGPLSSVSVFAADTDEHGVIYTYVVHDGITPAGTLNADGVLFIDDVIFEEVDGCDLEISTPAYSKTDETAEDADDGTITVYATSQYAIQYSLNNVDFQNSNVFTGLAPGTYTVYVQDLGGCTAAPITNIVVLEYQETPAPPDPVPPGEGILGINAQPLNKNNFITWFAADGYENFNSIQITNCFYGFPNAYRANNTIKHKHFPVIVNDETFSFYINFEDDYSYGNFSSLRLDVINIYGVVQQQVGTLNRVFKDDGLNYYIYANVILSDLPDGYYRLMIVDTSTDSPYTVRFVSNEIEVMSEIKAKVNTARLRFRSNEAIYKYLYDKITDYYNTIRVRFNFIDNNVDGDVTQYRAVTSGLLRNYAFDLDKYHTIETYYFDDLAHDAMYVFQSHFVIFINDVRFVVKELYKVTWSPEQQTNKGTIVMFEQAFSSINRYGDPNEENVTDPLLAINQGFIKL